MNKMPNIRKMQIAITLFEQVELFENADMIGILYHKEVPSSYKFIEDIIISNYRLSVYKNDRQYMVDVRHVGLFQIM